MTYRMGHLKKKSHMDKITECKSANYKLVNIRDRKSYCHPLTETNSSRKSKDTLGFEITHHDWMLGHCPNFYRSITEKN